MNENACQGALMTRTHQDEEANVYESPYQTGIVMNNTKRQDMKDNTHPEMDDDTVRLRGPQDVD